MNPHSIRLARPVAHHVNTKFALRSFDRVIYVANRRLDQLGNLGHHRAFGQSVQRLLDDHRRLLHLFHANEVAIVRIAVLADGYLKIEVRIRRVRLRFANVVLHARTAQGRTGQAEVYGFFGWKQADADGPLKPDSVRVQQRLVFVDTSGKNLQEVAHPLFEFRIRIPPQTADAKSVRGKPRADEVFEYLENLFAFAKAVQQHGDRADVHRVSAQPEQMRSDALKFGQNHSQVLGALWHFDLEHLLDAFNVAKIIGDSSHVIEPVPVRRDHRVGVVLADFFNAAMQEADVAVETDHRLAVQLQYDSQHPVCRGMLRTHVEHHLFGIEERLLALC